MLIRINKFLCFWSWKVKKISSLWNHLYFFRIDKKSSDLPILIIWIRPASSILKSIYKTSNIPWNMRIYFIEFSITQFGNICIFELVEIEDDLDTAISHLELTSKHHGKYNFALKWIQFSTRSYLCIFSVKGLQKCQSCQLCLLRENSNV